jgi:hypothetical protein
VLKPFAFPVELSSRVRTMIARDDLDQGGLAGAVVAQQSYDLVGSHLEVDVVHGLYFSKGLGDVLHLKEIVHLATPVLRG